MEGSAKDYAKQRFRASSHRKRDRGRGRGRSASNQPAVAAVSDDDENVGNRDVQEQVQATPGGDGGPPVLSSGADLAALLQDCHLQQAQAHFRHRGYITLHDEELPPDNSDDHTQDLVLDLDKLAACLAATRMHNLMRVDPAVFGEEPGVDLNTTAPLSWLPASTPPSTASQAHPQPLPPPNKPPCPPLTPHTSSPWSPLPTAAPPPTPSHPPSTAPPSNPFDTPTDAPPRPRLLPPHPAPQAPHPTPGDPRLVPPSQHQPAHDIDDDLDHLLSLTTSQPPSRPSSHGPSSLPTHHPAKPAPLSRTNPRTSVPSRTTSVLDTLDSLLDPPPAAPEAHGAAAAKGTSKAPRPAETSYATGPPAPSTTTTTTSSAASSISKPPASPATATTSSRAPTCPKPSAAAVPSTTSQPPKKPPAANTSLSLDDWLDNL